MTATNRPARSNRLGNPSRRRLATAAIATVASLAIASEATGSNDATTATTTTTEATADHGRHRRPAATTATTAPAAAAAPASGDTASHLSSGRQGGSRSSRPTLRTDPAVLQELMTFAIHDIADTWNETMGTGTTVSYWWVPTNFDTVSTACGTQTLDSLAAYCSADDTIYVSYEMADFLYTQFGDMAVVSMLAHEFGHNLQAEFGIEKVPGSPALELQADCISGAYIASAEARGLLDDGDLAEVEAVTLAVGDSGPSADPHGTSEQRLDAVVAGYVYGVGACVA